MSSETKTAVPGPLAWTPEWREAIGAYVGELASQMALRDWDISVNFDTPGDAEAYAEIDPHENQKRAEISFGAQFATLDADGIRQTLAHELIHCHLFNLHHLSEGLLETGMGRKRAKLGVYAIGAEIERATDALADAMAPRLPLPQLPAYPLAGSACPGASAVSVLVELKEPAVAAALEAAPVVEKAVGVAPRRRRAAQQA